MSKKIKIIFSNFFIGLSIIMFSACNNGKNTDYKIKSTGNNAQLFVLAEDLVKSARDKQDATEIFKKLAMINESSLFETLNSDEKVKAFWINIYNGSVQHILTDNPKLFDDRDAFFGEDRINVAGKMLSLDKIEHGFIRGSKIKISYGLIKDPFVSNYERNVRAEKEDGRIHFAVNCGAKSCPFVAVYDYKKLDEQLDEGTKEYLKKVVKLDGKTLTVSPLMDWFRGDFGNKDDVIQFIKKYDLIDPNTNIEEVKYANYDWTLQLGNYKKL